MSPQGRYEFAYNAARLIATFAVRASGYRMTAKNGYHYYTFRALEAADPNEFGKAAMYFDAARSKRNDFSYEGPVHLSETEADEIVAEVKRFQVVVAAWVEGSPPSLL